MSTQDRLEAWPEGFTTTRTANPEGERMVPKSELDAMTARAERAEKSLAWHRAHEKSEWEKMRRIGRLVEAEREHSCGVGHEDGMRPGEQSECDGCSAFRLEEAMGLTPDLTPEEAAIR